MVSITTVADRAKVSRMTVTRVLRGEERVAAKTRNRVLKVMKDLAYVPSPAARAMRSKDKLVSRQATCVAVVFSPDTAVDDGFFCEIARGIEDAAAVHRLCPLQVHWQNRFEADWPRLQSVFAVGGLCGAILIGQFGRDEVATVLKHTLYVVVVDGPAPADLPVASVESDNVGGCRLAIQRLVDGGCKRVQVMTGPLEHYFSQAMMAAGRFFPPERFEMLNFYPCQYTSAAGEAMAKGVWSVEKYFDGVFGNDDQAIGVLRGLADLGIRAPEEVKVIGFDDIPHAAYTQPRLTTIGIDKRQLGREAVAALVDLVSEKKSATEVKAVVKARLVVRESA